MCVLTFSSPAATLKASSMTQPTAILTAPDECISFHTVSLSTCREPQHSGSAQVPSSGGGGGGGGGAGGGGGGGRGGGRGGGGEGGRRGEES